MDYAALIKSGGIGVLATDTLYGLVASALNEKAVERVYSVRGRDSNKPCVVLISHLDDLRQFLGCRAYDVMLEKMWPGPVSVLLPCLAARFSYLERGTGEIAFRLPADEKLRHLILQTGPLIAPSANPQGMKPAESIEEARAYFGTAVDFYEDKGRKSSLPSTLLRCKDGALTIVREGAISVETLKSQGFTIV